MVAAGCSRTGGDEQTRSAGQQGYPTTTGRVTQIPPGQRVTLPEVSGPVLGGGSTTISTKAYAGKVVVINVWGSWCPPCREEAPELQAASLKTKDKAQFIGITVKDYAPAAAEAFVKRNKITYPSIFDPTGAVLLRCPVSSRPVPSRRPWSSTPRAGSPTGCWPKSPRSRWWT